jgi:hypothetical protein
VKLKHKSKQARQVWEAVNGSKQDLFFTTDPMPAGLTKECVLAAGTYNDFVPDLVNQAIDEITVLDPQSTFTIGREYSMVLYIESRLSFTQVKRILTQASPDEIDLIESMPMRHGRNRRIRVWWD